MQRKWTIKCVGLIFKSKRVDGDFLKLGSLSDFSAYLKTKVGFSRK